MDGTGGRDHTGEDPGRADAGRDVLKKARIRMTYKEGVGGILKTGRPAGLWLCRASENPVLWAGAAADGEHADGTMGTLGEVLDWLQGYQATGKDVIR